MGFYSDAFAVMLFNLLCLLPLFVGYWKLGRDTSLSPVETAKVRALLTLLSRLFRA